MNWASCPARQASTSVAEVTGDTAIVRFHSRNKETRGEKKGLSASSERFNCYYSREEMDVWVPRVRGMQERGGEIHPVVNTNYLDQGIVNSRLLGDLLGEGLRSSE